MSSKKFVKSAKRAMGIMFDMKKDRTICSWKNCKNKIVADEFCEKHGKSVKDFSDKLNDVLKRTDALLAEINKANKKK